MIQDYARNMCFYAWSRHSSLQGPSPSRSQTSVMKYLGPLRISFLPTRRLCSDIYCRSARTIAPLRIYEWGRIGPADGLSYQALRSTSLPLFFPPSPGLANRACKAVGSVSFAYVIGWDGVSFQDDLDRENEGADASPLKSPLFLWQGNHLHGNDVGVLVFANGQNPTS